MKKVMVFGVFDGLHEGHKNFLKEAKKSGEYLIVALAQDHIVRDLKKHDPKYNFGERLAHLEAEDAVDEVVIGDAKLSTWGVVNKYRPDVVVLGYDQRMLEEDLKKYLVKLDFNPELKVASSFEPNEYKSSIINK